MLGWRINRLDTVSDADIATLLGLSQEQRFFEKEHADMLFVVSHEEVLNSLSIDTLVQDVPLSFDGIANKLSPTMENWEIITEIENATSVMQVAQKDVPKSKVAPEPTNEAKKVIMQRRSIHVMDKVRSSITKDEFHTLLAGVVNSLDGKENAAHLAIFVHRVKEYESGIYILIRNERDKEALKEQMFTAFKWTQCEFEGLYLLDERDTMVTSQTISCSQEIASDGAFSLGMLCNFSEQLNTYGAHRYKELYWECGAIGQQLYLDATSMGLSGTGIGCFLDDMMHSVLGLESNKELNSSTSDALNAESYKFQVLYHFTVGRGYVDSRIQTQVAYEER